MFQQFVKIELAKVNDDYNMLKDIVSDDEYKTLKEGAEVEYEVSEGEKGPQAINVKTA